MLSDLMTRKIIGIVSPAIPDPSCKMLREGFLGAYQFSRVAVSGEDRFTDQPDKNRWSHVAEALQYAVLRIEAGVRSAQDELPPPPQQGDWGLV